MHEILDFSTSAYLKRNNQRYSFRSRPQKATICYVVLPSQNAQWKTLFDPMCEDSDYYHGESSTSMLVDRSSLNLTQEHQRRFARAMRKLGLKPSVHPSQLQQELSATSAVDNGLPLEGSPRSASASSKDESGEENDVRDVATKRRIKDLEQSQWPKLMLLSNQTYSDPY